MIQYNLYNENKKPTALFLDADYETTSALFIDEKIDVLTEKIYTCAVDDLQILFLPPRPPSVGIAFTKKAVEIINTNILH